MTLRQAQPKDKEAIMEIVHEIHLDIPQFVWSEADFVARQIQNKEYFVIEDNGNLVGAMSLRRRSNKINIETLAVKKEFRGAGVGSAFIEFAKQFTKTAGCNIMHVYSFSEYRIADFYIKKGFKVLDCSGYYQNHKYDCFELNLLS